MGKTRNTGKLATQIQFDNSNNLVIGNSTSSSFNTSGSVNAIGGITGSIFGIGDPTSFSASISSDLVNLESKSASVDISISNINNVTSSNLARLSNLETKSASVDISITNINSITASNIARLNNLETKSASVDISVSSLNTFSASNGNTSLNLKTGSYATTGSNTFFGTQTYSGSVYIANDLIVQGSSSIQYISASSVSIGTNIVQLNTANPSVRFAGLTVIDSGSIGGSGSFLYDSVEDEFIFVHRGNGTNVTSSHFIMGPETFDNLGNETYLTCNILTKGTGKEHLVDSCIFDNGTTTCIKNNLVGTGTMSGTTIYGSTAVCSPVGKFTTCIDAGSGNFSGALQGDYLVVGTTAATSGGLRLGTQVAIRARNVANTANIPLIESTATDGVSVSNGALIITCTGRVGIGQTAPGVQLSVGGQSEQWQLGVATLCGTSGALIGSPSANILAFGNWAGTERMRIDASGNVGIGTCVPSQQLSFGMLTNSATRTYTTDNQGTLSFYNLTTGNLEAYLDIASVRTGNDDTLGGANIRFLTQTVCSITSACERMRITSSGQVAIGATSNFNNFTIKSSSDTITSGGLSFQSRTAVTNYIAMGLNSCNDFEIQTWTAPSWITRMYIKNDGNIGIGTTSPSQKLHIASSSNPYIRIDDTGVNSEGGVIMQPTGYNAKGGLTLNFSNGEFKLFTGETNNGYFQTFYTNGVERMRITACGGVVIGSCLAAPTGAENGWWVKTPNETRAYFSSTTEALAINRYGSTGIMLAFDYIGSGKGNISTNGSAISYNTTSDYRLKEDLKEVSGLDKISAIKVYDFKWKSNDNRMDGVLAHELQQILPYAVIGEKDAEQMQGVDYSKLVPILIKGMQEQQCTINLLKSCAGIV